MLRRASVKASGLIVTEPMLDETAAAEIAIAVAKVERRLFLFDLFRFGRGHPDAQASASPRL